MVGAKTLKTYGFSSITEYFDMCVKSKINGNRSQAIDQVQKLSRSQKLDFMKYLKDTTSIFLSDDVELYNFFLTVVV